MAFAATSYSLLQYEDFINYWMKAYEQGTTTPKAMATDSSGGTTAAKFELNSQGFPVTAGSVKVIPFINGSYDLWLFPTELEADNNDTTNAIQLADNIIAPSVAGSGATAIQELTTATMTANTNKAYEVGDLIDVEEYSTGNGGAGRWKAVLASGVTENAVNIIAGVADITISFVLELTDSMNVAQFGIIADATDESDSLQIVLNLGISDIHLIKGKSYAVSQHNTGPDYYGVFINTDNTTLHGNGSELYRIEADITSEDDSYSILLIGTPDSDVAAATFNVTIKGCVFRGLNTQHSVDGSTPDDDRYAINNKNTNGSKFIGNTFNAIDSRAITFQQPFSLNPKNASRFNETKNYNTIITGNIFNATPHAVTDRALIRAILLTGVDNAVIDDNTFNWTDDGVNSSSKYERMTDSEDDTWTPSGWGGNPLKRVGRFHKITNNHFFNNSEHACYMSSMDVVVDNNTFHTDEPAICLSNVKIRSKGATISNNTFSNVASAVEVTEPSYMVTVSGNNVEMFDRSHTGGLFSLNVQGIVDYVDNREWLSDRITVNNIKFVDNSAIFPATARLVDKSQIMFKIVTDSSTLTEYPEKNDIELLTIKGNTVQGAESCVFFQNGNVRGVTIEGNTFFGKDFTRSGFTTASANSDNVIAINGSGATSVLLETSFKDNTVQGFTQVFGIDPSYVTASSRIPPIISGNTLSYVEEFSDTVYRLPASNNIVEGNYGTFMLDEVRWNDDYINFNSLSDGSGSDSGKQSRFQKVGATIRVYTDGAGTFETITLT